MFPIQIGQNIKSMFSFYRMQESPFIQGFSSYFSFFFFLIFFSKNKRYGDESKLAPFMGVLQAIVSFVDDQSDEMRSMIAGDHKIVFLVKGFLFSNFFNFIFILDFARNKKIKKDPYISRLWPNQLKTKKS